MKIYFGSKLFKYIYDSEYFEVTQDESKTLCISNDLNFSKISSKLEQQLALEDYKKILSNVITIEDVIFSGISEDLIIDFLKYKSSYKMLEIFNTKLDFSKLDGIDLEELETLHLGNINFHQNESIPTRFNGAAYLRNLKTVFVTDSPALDITAFFEDLPNPEVLNSVSLSYPLPDPEIFSRFTQIESLTISNVQDPDYLFMFLNNIPLKQIKSLTILNCDMNSIDEVIGNKLESISNLTLISNKDANFNQILDSIPNSENLREIKFTAYRNPENIRYTIVPKLLKRFKKLEKLSFSDMDLDMSEFHEALLELPNIENLILKNVNLPNLDFLKGIDPKIAISIKDSNFNLNLLTPEIIMEHYDFCIKYLTNTIHTHSTSDGNYDLFIMLSSDDLYFLKDIIANAKTISNVTIDIYHNSNGVNQTLAFLTPYLNKCINGYNILLEEYSVDSSDIYRLSEVGGDALRQISVASKSNEDRKHLKRFTYTRKQYEELQEKIQDIVKDIPKDLPDLDKFMIIYRRLGSSIVYDEGIIGENTYSNYAKDNVDNCRNSVNGLLRHTCVCAGYADILYNCLMAVGIEAHKITGLTSRGYHQWNKVILDGVCYNTDLT